MGVGNLSEYYGITYYAIMLNNTKLSRILTVKQNLLYFSYIIII